VTRIVFLTPFVCVSVFFRVTDISKTDAAKVTDTEMSHDESWKPILEGWTVKIMVTSHKNITGVNFALLWVLAFI